MPNRTVEHIDPNSNVISLYSIVQYFLSEIYLFIWLCSLPFVTVPLLELLVMALSVRLFIS